VGSLLGGELGVHFCHARPLLQPGRLRQGNHASSSNPKRKQCCCRREFKNVVASPPLVNKLCAHYEEAIASVDHLSNLGSSPSHFELHEFRHAKQEVHTLAPHGSWEFGTPMCHINWAWQQLLECAIGTYESATLPITSSAHN